MTKQIRKGYGTVILASLAYGVMPVVSKLLLLSGMNSESVVFYRFFLTCLFSALILAAFRGFRAVTLPQAVLLALFGILGFGFTMQFSDHLLPVYSHWTGHRAAFSPTPCS